MSFAGIIRERLFPYKGATLTILTYILIHCNHSDNPNYLFKNKLFPLKRGQLITSLSHLSEMTGLSVQQIRTVIKKLQQTQPKILTDISTDVLTNQARLLTIENIDEFLIFQNPQQTNQQTNQQTKVKKLTTNNKDITNNDYSNKNIYLDEFQKFWESYGKIGNKQNAMKMWQKTREVGYETIIAGLERYQTYCRANGTERKYIKHASTWLSSKGWEDEYPIDSPAMARNTTADDNITAGINAALFELAQRQRY